MHERCILTYLPMNLLITLRKRVVRNPLMYIASGPMATLSCMTDRGKHRWTDTDIPYNLRKKDVQTHKRRDTDIHTHRGQTCTDIQTYREIGRVRGGGKKRERDKKKEDSEGERTKKHNYTETERGACVISKVQRLYTLFKGKRSCPRTPRPYNTTQHKKRQSSNNCAMAQYTVTRHVHVGADRDNYT